MQRMRPAYGKVNFGLVIAFVIFIIFTLLFYGKAIFRGLPGFGSLIYHAGQTDPLLDVAAASSEEHTPTHYELWQVEFVATDAQHDALVLHFNPSLPKALPQIINDHQVVLPLTQLAASFQSTSPTSAVIKGLTPVQETDQLILDLTLAEHSSIQQIDRQGQTFRLLFHQASAHNDGQMVMAAADKIKKKEIKPTPQQQAERIYQQSLDAANQGDFKQAMHLAEQVLSYRAEHHDARQMVILSGLRMGAVSLAEQVLEQGLLIAPDYGPFIKLKARRLIAHQQDKAALIWLQQRHAQWRHDTEYNGLLAALYQQSGQHGKAIQLYRHLLKTQPYHGVWWAGLAVSIESQGHPQEALQVFKQASTLGGLDPSLREYVNDRIAVLQS